MPTRRAHAIWEGGLQGGKGSFEGESGAVSASYSFGSRFGDAGGSNPEELLAAAEAACYSMALSVGLEQAGHTGTRVRSDAACTVEKQADGFKITGIKLKVRATVPGMDAAAFQQLAEATKAACPVSKALAAVPIELDAALE
ncbi:MAG: Osmotically inducible protein [Gemmatimonadetes bacterium]|nr:Osmotically inducible protein [Gemmatimonadota bacterium]